MARIALLTSATAGGGGIAAKRVYSSLLHVKTREDHIDLLDMTALGGPIPADIAPHCGGSNKSFSDTHYTVEYPGYVRSDIVDRLTQYDAINIHWCSYLLSLSEVYQISLARKNVVFTCHDFYYFLGGCHYPHTCTSWQSGCLRCPQVDRQRYPNYSPMHNLQIKRQIFSLPNVWLTAPSNYLASMATVLLPNAANHPRTIRNPLDGSVFFRSRVCQKASDDRKVRILLVADSAIEKRKAFPLGVSAVAIASEILFALGIMVETYIVGGESGYLREAVSGMDTCMQFLGRLQAEELAEVYRKIDIVFSPSLEDNWPNILVEAFACGANFVVGPGHGCEEFVSLYKCGEIADSYEVRALAQALVTGCIRKCESGVGYSFQEFKQFAADHDPLNVGSEYMAILKSSCSW
jgi:glycosyltransferase involved in cell wall biosynthesis